MAAESRIKSTGDLIRERRWSERLRVILLAQILRASVRRHRIRFIRWCFGQELAFARKLLTFTIAEFAPFSP